jgi:hypothetical protein
LDEQNDMNIYTIIKMESVIFATKSMLDNLIITQKNQNIELIIQTILIKDINHEFFVKTCLF